MINRPHFELKESRDWCHICLRSSKKTVLVYGKTENTEFVRICEKCFVKMDEVLKIERHEMPNCKCHLKNKPDISFSKKTTANHENHINFQSTCLECQIKSSKLNHSQLLCPNCKINYLALSPVYENPDWPDSIDEIHCNMCHTHWGRNPHW